MQEQVELRSIGKYKIVGILGRGSMGVVYKAQDPEIGRVVALKVLRNWISADQQKANSALERFKTEARSAGNLRHPNIITLFDVNCEETTPYIVMDYIEGEGLDSILRKTHALEPEVVLHFLSQVAAGLDYAHSKGVIHRDIKPSNILIDKAWNAYIVDFGVASMGGTQASAGNVVLGTPGYMSPEQILNKPLSHSSDLFSFAIVAFECLTGTRPFPGDDFASVVNRILHGRPLSLTELVHKLPLALEVDFDRAFAREPENRFSNARMMLERFAKSLGIERFGESGSKVDSQAALRKRKVSEWRPFGMKEDEVFEAGAESADAAMTVKSSSAEERVRFDTTKEFSPWRFERRKVQADQFAVYAVPERHDSSPGDMFGHENVSFGIENTSPRDSRVRKLIGFFAVMCLFLAGVIVWLFLNRDAPARSALQQIASPLVASRVAARSVDSGLVIPKIDVASPDKSVLEMSNTELLGVLVTPGNSDDRVLKALTEARKRRVAELVDACVGLLQSDSYVVRIEALKTFASIGDRRITPTILLSLSDHDPLVRGHAAKALMALGDRSSVSYLMQQYTKEDSPDVKALLKQTIEKINGYPLTE